MTTTAHVIPESRDTTAQRNQQASTTCIAIVWLKNQSKSSPPYELVEALNQFSGVDNASLAPSRARVVIVQYDHDKVCATDVLQMIRQNGYEAVLIGC